MRNVLNILRQLSLISSFTGTICCLLILQSCVSGKNHQLKTPENDERQDKTAFLIFAMQHDSLQRHNTVQLTGQTIVDGTFKINNTERPGAANYLKVEISNAEGEHYAAFAEHPLIRRVEYEEGNELVSKVVRLQEADFFVRVPIRGTSPMVKLTEYLESGQEKILLIKKLE